MNWTGTLRTAGARPSRGAAVERAPPLEGPAGLG
jgi:hypothetical protein